MNYIVDMSKFQKSDDINWSEFAKQVSMLIIRVQYGSLAPDKEYPKHVANAKKYNLPFLTYAFPEFVSVNDARVEARDAARREDKESHGMVIDIETEYYGRRPAGISKLPYQVRLDGIKAYVDELRKQGVKKVGGYIGHNVYKSWGIDKIVDIFDFVWIPLYGNNDGKPHYKPEYPCDLWQFTSVGRLNGYSGNLDLSMFVSDKDIYWFTDTKKPSPTPSEKNPDMYRLFKGHDIIDTQDGKLIYQKLLDGYRVQSVPEKHPISVDMVRFVNKDGNIVDSGDTINANKFISQGYIALRIQK